MASSDSLHLFIAATMDNVEYTGYNGEPIHQDVFLGWINEGFNGELLSIGNEKIAKNMLGLFLQIGHKIILKQLGHKLNMIFLILQ